MDRCAQLREEFSQEPLGKALGASLAELSVGRAIVTCRPHRLCTIRTGIVQGGIIVALADFAGVYAAMTVMTDGHAPASSLHTHFLRPVSEGELLTATATVMNRSRSRILVEVAVMGSNALKARTVAEFACPRRPTVI